MKKYVLMAALVGFTLVYSAEAQLPSRPAPAPGSPDLHIFYGETPADGAANPVLVFFHGLRGTASDWWDNNNDMYDFAYRAGYRTAFLSLSLDNSRNDAPILTNAAVILDALPKIIEHLGVEKIYAICHSKGGLDLQSAMLQPEVASLMKGVFLISTPNTGTELADWAFGPGQGIADILGLLTPGVEALKTDAIMEFREQADPIFEALRIPFYTMAGRTSAGNILTIATGIILSGLVPDIVNDGLVPITRTLLPDNYGIDIGELNAHHFQTDSGNISFPRINAQIKGVELSSSEFRRVSESGFGDEANTWMWSMAWFKGKLFVGTGRDLQCTTFAAALVQTGQAVYPPPGNDCPPEIADLRLRAEIWQYTPEKKTWKRVYQSPEDVPVEFNLQMESTKFTARDSGYRGMIVFEEPNGQEALYVGGLSSSSIFANVPFYQTNPFPPPRILRSVDGEVFEPLPQDPGTFLGDIAVNSIDAFKVRGFRSFAVYKDRLFVTASDFRGIGLVVASRNPSLGNDAWEQVSPSPEIFPFWTLKVFNNSLYGVTGDRRNNNGYEVIKTDAEGDPPFDWEVVVTGGGAQSEAALRSLNGLSMEVLQGKLYVGTDRQTEMIRVNPDDSWDLVVGFPRDDPSGPKAPISGLGQWFGNFFNGHFWRMINWDGSLYMGTWDWSIGLRQILVLDSLFRPQYGSDVFRTTDGVYWNIVTKQGFGNPFNYGTRVYAGSPFGLYLGTAKPVGGGQILWNGSILDVDEDVDLDFEDVGADIAALNQAADGPDDPRDLNRDGFITALDARKVALACTTPGCEVQTPEKGVPAPQHLEAASRFVVDQRADLTWDAVPDAVAYRVFRSSVVPAVDLFPDNLEVALPGTGLTINIPDDFVSGVFNPFCANPLNNSNIICLVNGAFQAIDETRDFLGGPLPFAPIADTTTTSYSEVGPSTLQSIYYVIAIDGDDRQSEPSNLAGGPSWAIPVTMPQIQAAVKNPKIPFLRGISLRKVLIAVEGAARRGDFDRVRKHLRTLLADLDRRTGKDPERASGVSDLRRLLSGLDRTSRFIQERVYPADLFFKTPRQMTSGQPFFRH